MTGRVTCASWRMQSSEPWLLDQDRSLPLPTCRRTCNIRRRSARRRKMSCCRSKSWSGGRFYGRCARRAETSWRLRGYLGSVRRRCTVSSSSITWTLRFRRTVEVRPLNAKHGVRLRRWDHLAKVAHLKVAELAHYRPVLIAVARPDGVLSADASYAPISTVRHAEA